MTKRRVGPCFLLFLLVFFLSVETASPQSIWLDRKIDRAVFLEIQKPNFTREYLGGDFLNPPLKTTFATSIVTFSARWRFSKLFVLQGELPFASWGYENQTVVSFVTTYNYPTGVLDTSFFPGFSEEKFGNPLLGVQLGGLAFPLSGEFVIRFPLIQSKKTQKIGSDWAVPFGRLTDYDRFEAFLVDRWTFTSAVNLEAKNRGGLVLRLRTGLVFLVPTKDYLENDLYVDYAPQVGYQFHRVGLLAALTGRYLVTENSLDFGARTIHQLGFSANYPIGHFIPGAHFRLPLDDDLQQDVDFVFGLNIGYRLP